ncbi:MAG: S-methyl-5'-thioinosine phosphorylase [Cellvibrionaceae bacterium]
MKKLLGVIGGSGFDDFMALSEREEFSVETPFGVSKDVSCGLIDSHHVVFIPRHGKQHAIAPHEINYRANMWALKKLGVSHVLAINAVGGIHEDLGPGCLAIPDQIIDYSYGREHTYYSGHGANNEKNDDVLSEFLASSLDHIDFTFPYEGDWREFVLSQCKNHVEEHKKSLSASLGLLEQGVYGCTQGPRLETAAEVMRLKRDGCDMIGMTGMPEAALAKELSLPYACIAISVNWAAGLSDEQITYELIKSHLASRVEFVKSIIEDLSANLMNYSD